MLVRGELPPVYVNVIVDCGAYSCLAYVDSSSQWRTAFGKKEIREEVLGWLPLSCAIQANFRLGHYFGSSEFQQSKN